jgi:MoaA/NifB/PqqE/SkfB family radical SAM enzyme
MDSPGTEISFMVSGILRVGYGNVRNIIAEKIYTFTSIDFTRPTQIYAIVNRRCISRCRMCDSWREVDPAELDASTWIKFLSSLQSFNPFFNINFTGGEPLYKKDFLEILEYCSSAGIMAGFTTNGKLLTKGIAERLMKLQLFNIHFSIDSLRQEVHDKARGVPGMLHSALANLSYLIEQKALQKNGTPIFIKTNVFNENLDDLEGLVDFCQQNHLQGIIFQPILRWTDGAKEMFMVDQAKLDRTIQRMILLKRQGYPIIDSESQILAWKDHFNDVIPLRQDKCKTVLRNLTVLPDGDITLCGLVESTIGNIQTDDMKDVWYSAKTRELRKKLVNCTGVCTTSSMVSRSFRDYWQILGRLVRNN